MTKNLFLSVATVLVLSTSLASTAAHAQGFFDSLKSKLDAATDSSQRNAKAYQEVTDQQLVDSFYVLSADAKTQGINPDIVAKPGQYEFMKLTPETLTFREFLYKADQMNDLLYTMKSYSDSLLDDALGQRYAAFASSRGNVVKLYKPSLGGVINGILNQHFYLKHANNTIEWLKSDNVLIEYSPSGKVVSVMSRAHQAVNNFTLRSYRYTNLYFGAALAQFIENKIGNGMFNENFMRVVSPAGDVVKSQEPITAAVPSVPAVNAVTPPARVTTGSGAALSDVSASVATTQKRIQALKDLMALKQSGAITDEEFQAEKAKVLKN